MPSKMLVTVLLLALASFSNADVYLHNPRGSNNRLNEKGATRANGNRLFDSQNNNRGGYNVCDKTDNAYDEHTPLGSDFTHAFNPDVNTAQQYQMYYFEGSELWVEWTAQHGCGGTEQGDEHKTNCNQVLQYMCDTKGDYTDLENDFNPHYHGDVALHVDISDGGNTDRPEKATASTLEATRLANQAAVHGTHESVYHYYECENRKRNRGLFTADQNLRGDTAIYTRQNPNGNRRGLECPEERDYMPYWHPSPWRDIAMLTDQVDDYCPLYKSESMNVVMKYKCVDTTGQHRANIVAANNPSTCATAGGEWKGFTHALPEPECLHSPYSKVNSLGNSRNAEPARYKWVLPTIKQLEDSGVKIFTLYGRDAARCVFRQRYNITTDDYDIWKTNSSHNHNENSNPPVQSPVTQDPIVDVGLEYYGLQLAINTNQFGRTFQDRSHVFYIARRPSYLLKNVGGKDHADFHTVYNLNVRGKRGNIVQTFPSVEYDFMPNALTVEEGEFIHLQWCGSNTHNNNPDGGDGQAGDDGEGTGGTDRNNFVQVTNPATSFPMPIDVKDIPKAVDGTRQHYGHAPPNHKNIWDFVNCHSVEDGVSFTTSSPDHHHNTPCALATATSGHYRSMTDLSTKDELNVLLNNAPASFVGGAVLEFKQTSGGIEGARGIYYYMCTRNNNFTNRSQRGMINVVERGQGGNVVTFN